MSYAEIATFVTRYVTPCGKSTVGRTVQLWDDFLAMYEGENANTPLIDRYNEQQAEITDLRERVDHLEHCFGLPVGGRRSLDATIEAFLASVHGPDNNDQERIT